MSRPAALAIGALLFASVSVGCSRSPTEASALPLGKPFDLRAGASASLEGGLTITFDRVAADSRCPIEALCITAGDATVILSLSRGRAARVVSEVHTDPRMSEVSYLTYSIRLVALVPPRSINRQIQPDDYVTTLSVVAR